MKSELHWAKLTHACACCGERAVYATTLPFILEGRGHVTPAAFMLYLCKSCNIAGQLASKREVLPSHEPGRLTRSESFPPPAGTWFRSKDGSTTLGCPDCGAIVALTEIHSMAANGKVEPSFICPGVGCEFHTWITLEGWKESRS